MPGGFEEEEHTWLEGVIALSEIGRGLRMADLDEGIAWA